MSDKKENKRADEIDELLGDYKKQKARREKNFGKIDISNHKKINNENENSDTSSETDKSAKAGIKKREKSKNAGEKSGEERPKADEKLKTFFSRVKEFSKTKKGKRVIISSVAVICAAAAAISAAAAVNYQKTAYLREYEAQYPNVNFPAGIREEYCEQYAKVPSTTGHISIEACGYSGYVLQSTASTLPNLSFSNSTDGLDFNTVIHMPAGSCDLESAFGSAEDYLASSQNITYSTLFEDYDFTVIGAFYTNKNPSDDGGYVFPYGVTQKMTPISFNDYTDRLYHRFLYETDYKLNYDTDKLLTIAIDSDFMPDFEFVVVCALGAPAQESAAPNDSVHYPQAWYDLQGEINPYRFSEKWYPTVYTDDSEEETSIQSEKDYQ